ncbi:hypothetical protein BJP34_17975 [Moorena producens PAL-8-15-08-1]|uniref:Uncharacterized protein n=1 Tax=Moorena producens PAL-8-15-08-1 TaxID=1458985 RepID=A0A1D8TUC4_9CYAN|nr:hypothetical protein [Moorena producens]AOX01076.1 hypothetical protein BJP34_17975 [Moorena producens PAL-8-15-08-1]
MPFAHSFPSSKTPEVSRFHRHYYCKHSAISYQLSAISHQPSAISYQLSALAYGHPKLLATLLEQFMGYTHAT